MLIDLPNTPRASSTDSPTERSVGDRVADLRVAPPPAVQPEIGGNGQRAAIPPELTSEAAPARRPRRLRKLFPMVAALLATLLVIRAGVRWWQGQQSRLPAGIVYGNGRLEADEIDIQTKFNERLVELYANEGDLVHAGQVVARMDTRDLEAQRKAAAASLVQAARAIDEMQAGIAQQRTQIALAKKEVDRYADLVHKDFVTQEDFDQRQETYDANVATLNAAVAKLHEAEQAHGAALHVVELDDVNIEDNTLVAPRDGRIQYRIANLGEMLAPGSKVFTMLDATSVYMDIYLPTNDAGRIRLGADSRIVLDAYPNFPIPARVSYLASEAQFTPKAVETQSDRDKLMFRVKVRIDSAYLHEHEAGVRVGLPGVGYVRVDATTAWPTSLRGRVAAAPTS